MESDKPLSIGVIVDGNRRWARARGKSSSEGHVAGRTKFKECVEWCIEAQVGTLIAYTFSTENWNRPKDEVDALMILLEAVLREELAELKEHNCRVRILGNKKAFSGKIQELIEKAENETANNTGLVVALALSYGGRDEILEAVRQIVRSGITPEAITSELFEKHLSTAGLPDPDLIVRTSGESRLSNFLPWQGVYSELFFTPTLWPDLTKEEFFGILEQYKKRTRRFGR